MEWIALTLCLVCGMLSIIVAIHKTLDSVYQKGFRAGVNHEFHARIKRTSAIYESESQGTVQWDEFHPENKPGQVAS